MASASDSTGLSRRRCESISRTAVKARSRSPSPRPPFSRLRVMHTSTFSTRNRRAASLALCVGAISLLSTSAGMQGQRFYPDDPISREPESQDASKAAAYDQSQMYELMYNLFVTSGH